MTHDHDLKILGVIPARSGSKGVRNKNIREIGGKPLLHYIARSASESRYLSKVIVSTNDENIAASARSLGIDVPFIRPAELARDEVSIIPVNVHALQFFDETGWKPDIVVSLQATSPLTQAIDIDGAIELMLNQGHDSVVSMVKLETFHPFRTYRVEDGAVLPFEFTSERFLQRQDRPPAYKMNGAIFARKRHLLEQWSGGNFCLGAHVGGFVMPEERSVDVNTPLDLIVAETLIRKARVL